MQLYMHSHMRTHAQTHTHVQTEKETKTIIFSEVKLLVFRDLVR